MLEDVENKSSREVLLVQGTRERYVPPLNFDHFSRLRPLLRSVVLAHRALLLLLRAKLKSYAMKQKFDLRYALGKARRSCFT